MKTTLFSAAFLLTCLTVNTTATAASYYHTTLYYQPDGTYKEGADAGNLIGQVVNPDGLFSGLGVTYKAPEGQFWTFGKEGSTSGAYGFSISPDKGSSGFIGRSSLTLSLDGSITGGCSSGRYPVGLGVVCYWGGPGQDEGPDNGIVRFDELKFGHSTFTAGSTVEFSLESLADDFRQTPRSAVPVSAVPIPAASFMFAPALLGFMALRHKAKKLAA